MRAMKFGVGQPVKRVEDVRLVSGQGAYASDYAPEGALHAAFLRSPHAHATFAVTDIQAARAVPASPRHCVVFATAEIRTRSERESEMLRVVLNTWVTKTTAAEILANPATRRRQVTMTISLNTMQSRQTDAVSGSAETLVVSVG